MRRVSFPSRDEITGVVLRHLESYALTPEQLASSRKTWPGIEKGLITVEQGGARVNTRAGWWVLDHPHLVLSILRLLEVPLVNPGELVDWVKRQQHPDGYFQSSYLGITVRGATYAACVILRWLGAARDEDGWDRAKLVQVLRAQQQPARGHHFVRLPHDRRATATESGVAFRCIACLGTLGEALPDPQAAASYIQRKQQAHGAFSYAWNPAFHTYADAWATLDALRSLAILGAAPRDRDACVAEVQRWQVADGGIYELVSRSANPPQISDVINTAVGLAALRILDAEPLAPDRCRERIMQLWVPEHGGFMFGPQWDPKPGVTPESSYWGLLAMAASGLLGPARRHWREMFLFSFR